MVGCLANVRGDLHPPSLSGGSFLEDDGIEEERVEEAAGRPGCFIIDGKYRSFWRGVIFFGKYLLEYLFSFGYLI